MSFSSAMVIAKHRATPTKSVGYRFHPNDEELVGFYLKQKLLGCDEKDFPIGEVDFCRFEPWELPGCSKIKSDDQVWYFFCKRVYLNKKQKRYKRATKSGYWKPTGQCRKVGKNGLGKKKTLVFYRKKPIEMKTEWIAHEYEITPSSNQSKPGEFVIIKLKKNADEKCKKNKNGNQKVLTSNFENQIPNIFTTNRVVDGREFISSDFENQNCEEMTAMSTYVVGATAGMTAMPTYTGGMTAMPTYIGGTMAGMTAMPTYTMVEMIAMPTYGTIPTTKMPTYVMSASSHSTAEMITMSNDVIEKSQLVALSGEDQSSAIVVGFEDGEMTSQTPTNSTDDGREMIAISTYSKGNPSCQMVSDGENQSSITEFEGGGWSPSVASFPSDIASQSIGQKGQLNCKMVFDLDNQIPSAGTEEDEKSQPAMPSCDNGKANPICSSAPNEGSMTANDEDDWWNGLYNW